ncbi:acetate--CoA ligase family protein [Streptomyces sp. NPDC055037]
MFAPRGIAVVGASDRSGWSRYTVDNLARSGYRGEVHLVNRKGERAHGRDTHVSLADVPGDVDLAYVLTSPASLPELIAQAGVRGIPHLAVIAAGFGETGAEGAALEKRLVALAEENGVTLLGPNNLGFLNLAEGVTPWSHMMPWPMEAGGVGVLSQSGALGIYLLDYARNRDIGLSHLVTLGNEAMIGVAEGIDYLVDQPATRVIALYLESVRKPDEFVAAADRALRAGKPIVVLKTGRGATGAKVTAAHTGALAGNDAVYDAVFRQHGVIRVDTIEDLVTTAGLLDAYGVLPGNRVGFVTGSGAMCGVISDAADRAGISVPEFAPATVSALREAGLPDFATPQNPLDTTGYVVVKPDLLPLSQKAVANDPQVDVLVVNSMLPGNEDIAGFAGASMTALRELVDESPVPVIPMEFLPNDRNAFARDFRRTHRLPHLVDSLSRGVPALGSALWWADRHRASLSAPEPLAPPHEAVTVGTRQGAWSERQALALLAEHGVPVVPAVHVTSAEEALAAAGGFEGRVALKIVSPDLPHKSDVGGVVLDLAPDQAGNAFDAMVATVAKQAPDAALDGALVSPMRSGGVELLVGVVRDPVWGHILALGLGGVWVEVFGDTVLRRLPVTAGTAREALGELRALPLLNGARGGTPADLDTLAEVVAGVGRLAVALGEDLAEIEINPLYVHGDRVEALDALVRWAEQP